jgi:hypothetical protein
VPEIRSVVLAVGRISTAGNWNIVVGQAGLTLLLKEVLLTNVGAPTVHTLLYLARTGTLAFPFLAATDLTPLTAYAWSGWTVLMPSDELVLNLDLDTTLEFWVSGTALHGVEGLYVPPPSPVRREQAVLLPANPSPSTTTEV